MECKLHNAGQGAGGGWGALLRRGSQRLLQRLVSRHSAHLPDVDYTDPDRYFLPHVLFRFYTREVLFHV